MTKPRAAWLQHLAVHGETAWARMPKRKGSIAAITNQTWRPMINTGWIEAEFKTIHWSAPKDWHFKITDAGRAAIAIACPVDATG